MIDPKFRNINVLFVQSLKASENDLTRNYFDNYHMPLVDIRAFNALVNNKLFFKQTIKNKQEAYEMPVKVSRKNGYTLGNLLDYLYHQNCYKLVGIDLSRQRNTIISQQTNLTRKLEKDNWATMFFSAQKQKKTILSFSLDSLNVKE